MGTRRAFVVAILALLVASSPPARAADTALETVEFKIRIDDHFYIEADTKQAGNIELAVTPGQQQALDTVRVDVRTNLGRPYQILFYLGQEMMSERGFPLEGGVLYSVSNGAHGGRSEVSSPLPLTSEPTVVFSNRDGLSDQFTITLSVSAGGVIAAGRYRAPLVIEEKLL